MRFHSRKFFLGLTTFAACAAFVFVPLMPASAAASVRIAVSIPPQAAIARAVLSPSVEVECFSLMRANDDPHTFEPTQKQIVALSKCAVFFTAGLPYEATLVPRLRSLFPDLRIVDSSCGFPPPSGSMPLPFAPSDSASNSAASAISIRYALSDPDGDIHSGAARDPHTWLSFNGQIVHASNIAETVAVLLPASADGIRAGFDSFRSSSLSALVSLRTAKAAAAIPDATPFLVCHPAYGYLAAELGLEQLAIEKHGGQPPSKHLTEIEDRLAAHPLRFMLVQNASERARVSAFASAHALSTIIAPPMSFDSPAALSRLAADLFSRLAPASSSASPTP